MTLVNPINSELLLTREASLAAMSLGVGLTHIGKYNYAETGFFYSGLFSITIGLERVLKLILIYDHRLKNNDNFPNNNLLKKHSHGLSDMLVEVKKICDQYNLLANKSDIETVLSQKIISFLTDFAKKSRYYNLDSLSGQIQVEHEPLKRWNDDICSEIIIKHYRITKKRKADFDFLTKIMNDPSISISVKHTSDSGEPLNDYSSAMLEGDKIDTKQKYSRYYLYIIIRFACNVLKELEFKGNFYPCLREFFWLYMIKERSDILRKSSWNPHPPYYF